MAGVRPQGGRQDCNLDGLKQIMQFAEAHAIQNTPTVFLANGRRLVGATPPEQFVLELDAATR
jgi:thiol:disulfide interchange protein DsbC